MKVIADGDLVFFNYESCSGVMAEIGKQIERRCIETKYGMAYSIRWQINHGYLTGHEPKEAAE